MKSTHAAVMAALAMATPAVAMGQEGADRPTRTTCLTPQYAQEYYDRVTTATVKVIFEKILPARAQLTPARQSLESAQEAHDACREACEPHKAALKEARDRYDKVKAESDALQSEAAAEISAATRRIRAEYAPCPEDKPQ